LRFIVRYIKETMRNSEKGVQATTECFVRQHLNP
jgi:hypothetical protein